MNLTDEELYEGFTPEQIERFTREAHERFDPDLVRESEERLRNMSKAGWSALKREGEEIARSIAALVDTPPGDPRVQKLIARHHAMIEQFYPASAQVYRGLGQLYARHAEFREFYAKYHPGLADFMEAAMAHYADHILVRREQGD